MYFEGLATCDEGTLMFELCRLGVIRCVSLCYIAGVSVCQDELRGLSTDFKIDEDDVSDAILKMQRDATARIVCAAIGQKPSSDDLDIDLSKFLAEIHSRLGGYAVCLFSGFLVDFLFFPL